MLFSERASKSSVQYIYYKAKHFQHFHYIYNLTRDCHDRIERLRKTNDRANLMAEDIVIKIGIVGESTEDKLCSLLKRRGKVKKKCCRCRSDVGVKRSCYELIAHHCL